MKEKKGRKACQIIFLIVGFLTVLEFLFVRGMFTWLMAVMATVTAGGWNLVVALIDKRWLDACMYLICSVALCMGYFVIGG